MAIQASQEKNTIRKEVEKRKTTAAKIATEQQAKGTYGTSVTVHQYGSITELPSPIEKYVKAYFESGKNLQPTRIEDSPMRPKCQYLVNLLLPGNITLLCGASGFWKSNLMIQTGFAAAEGKPNAAMPRSENEQSAPIRVIYLSSERMADVFKERGYGKQPDLFTFYDNIHFKTPSECLEAIYQSAPHDQDCLIELDSLTNMFLFGKSSDNIADFLGIFRKIQEELSKRGVYWTLFSGHHTTKNGTDKHAGKADAPDVSKAAGICRSPHEKPFRVLWHEVNAPQPLSLADCGVFAEKAQHFPYPA